MSRLARDMRRWEAGEVPLDQVEAAHPAGGARALAGLYVRLAALREEPVPDPDASWSALRSRLADRPPSLADRARRRVLRPAAIALAAVLATGTVAYAAGVEPVRRVVDRAWDALTGLFDGEHESPTGNRGGRSSGPEPRARVPGITGSDDAGAGSNEQVQGSAEGPSEDEPAAEDGDGGGKDGNPHHDAEPPGDEDEVDADEGGGEGGELGESDGPEAVAGSGEEEPPAESVDGGAPDLIDGGAAEGSS